MTGMREKIEINRPGTIPGLHDSLSPGADRTAAFQDNRASAMMDDPVKGEDAEPTSKPKETTKPDQTLNRAQELGRRWVEAFHVPSEEDKRNSTLAERNRLRFDVMKDMRKGLFNEQDRVDFREMVFKSSGLPALHYATSCMRNDAYPEADIKANRMEIAKLIYGKPVVDKATRGAQAVDGVFDQHSGGRDPKKNAAQGFLTQMDSPLQRQSLKECIDDICMDKQRSLAQALGPFEKSDPADRKPEVPHSYYTDARQLADNIKGILDNDRTFRADKINLIEQARSAVRDPDAFRRAAILAHNESGRNLVLEIKALQD